MFKTLVVSVLVYGCQTWKMNKGDGKRIDVFHSKCLRRILKIECKNHVTNRELLEETGMKPLGGKAAQMEDDWP